jgi:L,D-transpeptidase catalytic domain
MRHRRIHLLILPAIVLIIGLGSASAANTLQAEKIVIVKSTRTMTLLTGDKVLKTYKVALGTAPVGPKRVEGDHKTPEGNYVIDSKNPQSQFHLALHISYPRNDGGNTALVARSPRTKPRKRRGTEEAEEFKTTGEHKRRFFVFARNIFLVEV